MYGVAPGPGVKYPVPGVSKETDPYVLPGYVWEGGGLVWERERTREEGREGGKEGEMEGGRVIGESFRRGRTTG